MSTLVAMFPDRMGIEETVSAQGVGVCGVPVPRFYKPGGCGVLLSSGGQYSTRCTWRGRGGELPMTGLERKPGPGDPEEQRGNREERIRCVSLAQTRKSQTPPLKKSCNGAQ